MNRSHQVEFVDLISSERRSTCSAESLDFGRKSSEHRRINLGKHVDSKVPGMETVVVTVSGYDSLSRGKLVSLIVHAGALNTGSLSICNTHVVCWKFQGRKYELAKKLRKKFISHRWFEDCLKAGFLLPEEPYIDKSGEEEEPLCWDDSVAQSPLGKALRKADLNINLSERSTQPETGSGRNTVASKREHVQSSDVDQSDTGWSPPISPKRACFAESVVLPQSTSLPRAGIVQAGSSGASHSVQVPESDEYVETGDGSADDRGQQTAELQVNPAPLKFMTGRAVDVPAPVCSSFMDHANGMRHQSGKEPYVSRCYTEVGQQARHSCSPITEDCGHRRNPDYKADYAQIRLEKRKEVEAPSGGLSEKYKRLMNESPSGGLSEKYRKYMNESPPSTSGKVTYGDERAGSMARPFKPSYLGSPSSQHFTRRIVSARVELDSQRGGYLEDNTDAANLLVQEALSSASPSEDIACVICHTETKPTTEGLLECGHRFCYSCIQKWADENTSKQSTCPLCKASFEFITIRELERCANQEICTQVLEERVVVVGKQIRQGQKINLPCPRTDGICITCESKDSPELLICCNRCGQRSCHTFCLDPPQPPGSSWFCSRCSPMRSRHGVLRRLFAYFCAGPKDIMSDRRQCNCSAINFFTASSFGWSLTQDCLDGWSQIFVKGVYYDSNFLIRNRS